jgi:hypothetical protein
MSNDHLVGWASSTLRYADELPHLNLRDRVRMPRVKGVVREDPVDCACRTPLDKSVSGQPNEAVAVGAQTFQQRSVLREALERSIRQRAGDSRAIRTPNLELSVGNAASSGSRSSNGGQHNRSTVKAPPQV